MLHFFWFTTKVHNDIKIWYDIFCKSLANIMTKMIQLPKRCTAMLNKIWKAKNINQTCHIILLFYTFIVSQLSLPQPKYNQSTKQIIHIR